MATDIATSAASAATGARTLMSHRIPMESPPLAAAGIAASTGSTAWSFLANHTGGVFGMIDAASLLSLGGAVLAIIFGGLIPKGLDAWEGWRTRKRTQDKLDRDAVADDLKEMKALQAEVARLQGVIRDMLEQSSKEILGEVDHVLRNVKQGNSLGGAVTDAVVNTIIEVRDVAKSTNRRVARVEEKLASSSGEIPVFDSDSDPDAPTMTPPPGTKLPPEAKP